MDYENTNQENEKATDNERRAAAKDLFELLSHLQWLLLHYHMHNRRQHGPMGDPHRGQGRVLKLLLMRPEISQKELTYLLDMRPQSLGELLTKLERGGYITREPSTEDRRVMNIKLTEKGKHEAENIEPKTGLDELFMCLTEEEQSVLSGYLSRVIGALEAQMEDNEEFVGWGRRGRAFEGFDRHCPEVMPFGWEYGRRVGFGWDGRRPPMHDHGGSHGGGGFEPEDQE